MEPVEQTTSRGTKMPAYRIRWRDGERPEIVLQHADCRSRSASTRVSASSLLLPRPESAQAGVPSLLHFLFG